MTTPVLCISMYIVADKGPNKYGLRTRIWPTGRHLRRPGLSSLRTSTLHGYHKHITWVSHAKHGYHMPPHEYHIPPHEYHMHTTWASHAHHMGITCHHIGITCTPHEYHMQKTWASHAQHMGITWHHMGTVSHAHHMGITCTYLPFYL